MSIGYRNIAIIAHVDHGKTTLVDKLLREGGAFTAREEVEERAMDSMDLEREKGITIKAKNASLHWGGVTINITQMVSHMDWLRIAFVAPPHQRESLVANTGSHAAVMMLGFMASFSILSPYS